MKKIKCYKNLKNERKFKFGDVLWKKSFQIAKMVVV